MGETLTASFLPGSQRYPGNPMNMRPFWTPNKVCPHCANFISQHVHNNLHSLT